MATEFRTYSRTPASNQSPSPAGFPEGWLGEQVNNAIREFVGSWRTQFEEMQFFDFLYDVAPRGDKTITRTSDTQFHINGVDVTSYFTANRRVRLQPGGEVGWVISSSFSTDTFVVVNMDAGVVPASITQVELSPFPWLDPSAFSGGSGWDVGDSKVTTYAVGTPPYPWLEENGQELAVADWPELAAKYGATGTGDGLYDNSPAAGNFNVADMRGMAAIGPAKSVAISGITQANPGKVTTATAHGFTTGDQVYFQNVGGMVEVNGNTYTATVTGATEFEIVDTSGFTAYTSGGTATEAVVRTVGQSDGSKDVTLSNTQVPAVQDFAGSTGTPSGPNQSAGTEGSQTLYPNLTHTHTINHGHTQFPNAQDAHSNRQPSMVRGWLVKGK